MMKGPEHDGKTLNDLLTIPPHRRRPLRFSLRLTAFSYALSFAAHASVVAGMVLTPAPAAPPRSAKAGDMPAGERRPVAIAMMQIRMSDFAQPGQSKPSDRVAPPSDTPPTDASDTPIDKPLTEPVAPDAPERRRDARANKPSATTTEAQGEPSITADAGATEPPAEPTNERVAQRDTPTPKPLEPVPTPTAPTPDAQPATERNAQAAEALRDKLAQLDLLTTTNASPSTPQIARPIEQDNPLDKPAPPREELPATASTAAEEPPNPEPATPNETSTPETTQTVDANPDTPEPKPAQPPTEPTPTATTAAADPSPPTQPAEQQPDTPAAAVYDEDSVDQPIAFKDLARPEQSAVSRRLGDTGTVRILVEVDVDGTLIRHEVLDDADEPRLLAAALKALDDSTFRPAEHKGEPVRSTRVIEYRF